MYDEENLRKMQTMSEISNALYKHQQIVNTPAYQAALARQAKVQPLMSAAMSVITAWQTMLDPVFTAINSFYQKYAAEIAEMEKINPIMKAVAILREHQYVHWYKLEEEFINEILYAKDDEVDEILYKYEMKDNGSKFNTTVKQCRNSSFLSNNLRLFDQTIATYKNGQYDVAVAALFSLLDGILSKSSSNNDTSMSKRLEKIIDKMDFPILVKDSKYSRLILVMTFSSTIESLSEYSNFGENEPSKLNRHWIMHGRSTRENKPIDCIKILNCIYGVILLDQFQDEENI